MSVLRLTYFQVLNINLCHIRDVQLLCCIIKTSCFSVVFFSSVNLSSNVRTLQANNRSLALQVAKLREEMRRVFNEHMNLLQHNHNLNERILELERQLDMAPSIIEHEVHSRCQVSFFKSLTHYQIQNL